MNIPYSHDYLVDLKTQKRALRNIIVAIEGGRCFLENEGKLKPIIESMIPDLACVYTKCERMGSVHTVFRSIVDDVSFVITDLKGKFGDATLSWSQIIQRISSANASLVSMAERVEEEISDAEQNASKPGKRRHVDFMDSLESTPFEPTIVTPPTHPLFGAGLMPDVLAQQRMRAMAGVPAQEDMLSGASPFASFLDVSKNMSGASKVTRADWGRQNNCILHSLSDNKGAHESFEAYIDLINEIADTSESWESVLAFDSKARGDVARGITKSFDRPMLFCRYMNTRMSIEFRTRFQWKTHN